MFTERLTEKLAAIGAARLTPGLYLANGTFASQLSEGDSLGLNVPFGGEFSFFPAAGSKAGFEYFIIEGTTDDRFGDAKILGGTDSLEMEFTKTYSRRGNGDITYKLTRHNDVLWRGQYSWPHNSMEISGYVNLLLVPTTATVSLRNI